MRSHYPLSLWLWITLVLLTTLAPAAATFAEREPEDELAFFLVADGHRKVIPRTIDHAPEDHWRELTYTDATRPMLRLELSALRRDAEDEPLLDQDLQQRLVTALENTHRFLVEPTPQLPAPYRVEALCATLADGSESLVLRLVDTASEQVVQSVESHSSALDAALINDNRTVYRLTRWLDERPWAATVLRVEPEGRVVIDAGSRQGLGNGTKLLVLSRSLPLVDPESGRLLGTSRGVGCELLVTGVEATQAMAIVTVEGGCPDLSAGDRVELSS